MKNKFVQPKNTGGCGLYCLSNMLNKPLFEQLNSNPWLKEMTDRKEEKVLRQFSFDEFKILPILYHNSNLKYISYQQIDRAVEMVMEYPELNPGMVCIMPLTIDNGVLHRIYLYVQKDRVMLSDPLQEQIVCFSHNPENFYYASKDLKMYLTRNRLYPYRLQIIGTIDDLDQERPVFFEISDFDHLFK